MDSDWTELERRLAAATGGDSALDKAIADAFHQPEAPYSVSVSACQTLVGVGLPGWHLHLGFGATGLFPYASLRRDGVLIMSDAPTVPLAILRSAVAAQKAAAPSTSPGA